MTTLLNLGSGLVGDPRKLWRRYIMALALIASLIGGAHGLQVWVLGVATQDAGIINIAGRQRMLSQRIMFLSLEADQQMGGGVETQLSDAVDLFATSHDWLLDRPHLNETVVAFYTRDGGLDDQSRAYIRAAEAFLTALETGQPTDAALSLLRAEAREDLLAQLNEAVTLLEQDATARSESLLRVAELVLFAAILILALEGLLIFAPAQRVVTRALDTLEDQNTQIQTQKQEIEEHAEFLQHAAHHDPLTGLANRTKLFNVLQQKMANWRATGGTLALMQIDLDYFKDVNDTHGHPAGDHVLLVVADRLTQLARTSDLIARVGGDEFIVVAAFDEVNATHEARKFAANFIFDIAEAIPYGDTQLQVGASIGVAFVDDNTTNCDDLIAQADAALYQAKGDGRGVVRLSDAREVARRSRSWTRSRPKGPYGPDAESA